MLDGVVCIFVKLLFFFWLERCVAVDFSSDAMVYGRNIVPHCDVSAILAIVFALVLSFCIHFYSFSPDHCIGFLFRNLSLSHKGHSGCTWH